QDRLEQFLQKSVLQYKDEMRPDVKEGLIAQKMQQKITENTRNRDVNIFEKAPVSTPLSIDGGDSHLLGKEGPSLSPPSSEMVEVFPGCVLSVLATCSVFIPLFISGLAGLYANRGQKGYWEEKESMPGKHLMSSGLIIFHEISDQEKDQGWYCGIPEPLISKESPYYTPHMEGRIKRNKKTFCYQFLFPVFPLKREEFLLNCIKSDSD
ncbi:MAG: hypothetical protein EOO35_00885, partial [Cyanobacteriota bacterium]